MVHYALLNVSFEYAIVHCFQRVCARANAEVIWMEEWLFSCDNRKLKCWHGKTVKALGESSANIFGHSH